MIRHAPIHRQRGEGKVGCFLTLLVLGVIAAVALQVVPVYYSNSNLEDACTFIATSASRVPLELVEKQVRDKARDLGMQDVLAQKGAISVSKVGGSSDGGPGTCTIRLHYKRTVNLYGLYQFDIETDKTISQPILENIG